MTQIIKSYIPSIYGQLHYRIADARGPQTLPPLLCLHQTPSTGGSWDVILPDLADGRPVIAPDAPGYGMSDPPLQPISIADFAQTMIRFIADLAVLGIVRPGPFDVIGAHTGSIIATELARTYPERVRRIVLFGLAAYDAETRRTKLATLRDRFPVPTNDLSHVERLWAIISTLSDPRMSAEERHVGMAESLRLGSRMPWAYEAVYRYDFLRAMTEVEQPALIVNPEDDLWAVTGATSAGFRNGRRFDLPGAKHGVLSIEKERVLREIREFLDV